MLIDRKSIKRRKPGNQTPFNYKSNFTIYKCRKGAQAKNTCAFLNSGNAMHNFSEFLLRKQIMPSTGETKTYE